MAHDHFQPSEGSGQGVAAGIVAEAQERLRQYRQRADEAVVVQHRRVAAQVRRRSLIGAVCAAAMLAPAVVGERWLGLPLGALLGALLVYGPLRRLPLAWILAIVAGTMVLAGLPFVRLDADRWLLTSLGMILGILALMTLHLALRWIAAPITAAVAERRPDGDIGLVGGFTPPEELVARADAGQAVSAINGAVSELQHRSSFILVVVVGMALTWLLHPLGNIASGGGWEGGIGAASEAARMQSLLALIAGLASAWIARSEMPVPLAMLAYGLGVGGTQIAAILCGFSAFTVWTSIWIWGAWIVAGGGLALLAEHRDEAVPKRVT